MATLEVKVCDLCGLGDECATMAVVWRHGEEAPWEIDLCSRCYNNRMSDMKELGRRASISNVRPQARVKKTHITAANL